MVKFTTILFVIHLVVSVQLGFTCKISEFLCRNSQLCLPLDRYCDGRDDCGDKSDEPKGCTVCNRTYYGDVGRTYSLRVPPPQWNRLPFLCHLTFTASGHDQGDIVQIIFDSFSVGRFDEGLVDGDLDNGDTSLSPIGELPGCPEGFMQLSELGRPFTGGSWCGAASGHQLYFSETSTVTASVKVFHAPMQAATPFEFRIRYKFIPQSDAIVRYGGPNEQYELGKVTPGTYCTRQFDECYRKKCRLQSPNYPGMYPRNVTCYWTIRQKLVPTCKHAMVAVSQENEHKALVKRSLASYNKTVKTVRAWSDCTGERDHLIFYDGSSTNDPVLAKYCGGDWLPKVVSRGPEMLVAFHSSPFSAPLQTGIPNRGFELDVDVLFVDSDSYDYAQGTANKCEFHINASKPDDVLMMRRGRMGRILSPRHTLPPNTTCTYYFYGHPTDLVWVSFTSYHLQILQPVATDNTTYGRNEIPPWIIRLRIYDSTGSIHSTAVPPAIKSPSTSSSTTAPGYTGIIAKNLTTPFNYYASSPNPFTEQFKINVDNAWNPVDNYIYGPTSNSVFNQPLREEVAKKVSPSSKHKDILNVISSGKYNPADRRATRRPTNRRLIAEFYDNEAPKLCDHSALGTVPSESQNQAGVGMRGCTPLESYISAGHDMKIEFHSLTGSALYPTMFEMKYEFVDTDLGGEVWPGKRGEDVPPLCSRVFRKRKGDLQGPRNVFLHGRGGAKNITCLYRFEANVGERIRVVLHNVSFGDVACTTEADPHTGHPRCMSEIEDPEQQRIGELRIFDVPQKEVKVPLGCFCDNTSSLYNSPITFQSHSKTLEMTFLVTRLNVSEDFADVYFYASYEFVKMPECHKKTKLKGPGGEENIEWPLRRQDSSCDGIPWVIEAQEPHSSLFIQTWGTYLPIVQPTLEDTSRCLTKNRLVIYSGQPLRMLRVICPSTPGSRTTALHIFSEDWMNSQQMAGQASRAAVMVLEAVNREDGQIAFTWLEIQRTKASLIQQLDIQTNYTANETFDEFGLYPRMDECEHKCPELDACIGANLWCDGRPNCPSGYDESEEQCGKYRLFELPGGIFAIFGCIAASLSACLIFCILGLVRKRKKPVDAKNHTMNGGGTLQKNHYKKEPFFFDPDS